jgi:hypothetical protein
VIRECLAPRDGGRVRRDAAHDLPGQLRPGGGFLLLPPPAGGRTDEIGRSCPPPAAVVATAWDPPTDVRERVPRAAEISGADCGSLELLYDTAAGGLRLLLRPEYALDPARR